MKVQKNWEEDNACATKILSLKDEFPLEIVNY